MVRHKFIINTFFYKSSVISKIINSLVVNGLKEKTENRVLSSLKKIDHFVLLEMVYALDFSFRFYTKKKRTGRRSFKHYKTLVHVKPAHTQTVAVCKLIRALKHHSKSSNKKYVFKESEFLEFVSQFIKSNGTFLENETLFAQKQVLCMRAVRHFR